MRSRGTSRWRRWLHVPWLFSLSGGTVVVHPALEPETVGVTVLPPGFRFEGVEVGDLGGVDRTVTECLGESGVDDGDLQNMGVLDGGPIHLTAADDPPRCGEFPYNGGTCGPVTGFVA